MKYIKCIISSFLGGACIGLGGIAYLSVESTIVGAFLFSIGLISICIFNLNLYTGKISYLLQTKDIKILIILGGNVIGAMFMGWLLKFSHITKAIIRAEALTQTKVDTRLLRLFVLAVLCNICIYIAVHTYKTVKDGSKYLVIILAIMTFVLCGFEHSIADAFYFTVSGWTIKEWECLLITILGNAVGGIVTHNLRKIGTYK